MESKQELTDTTSATFGIIPAGHPSVANLSVGDTVKVRIHQYDNNFKVYPGVVTDTNPFFPPSVDVSYLSITHNDFSLETVVVLDDDENVQVAPCEIGRETTALFTAKRIYREKVRRLEIELQQAKEDGARLHELFPGRKVAGSSNDPVM